MNPTVVEDTTMAEEQPRQREEPKVRLGPIIEHYTDRVVNRAIIVCFVVALGVVMLWYLAANGFIMYLGLCHKNSRFYGAVNCSV
jgi:hypothetical protein